MQSCQYMLLHTNMDKNPRDIEGWTPLMIAEDKRDHFICDFLIVRGAEINKDQPSKNLLKRDFRRNFGIHGIVTPFASQILGGFLSAR